MNKILKEIIGYVILIALTSFSSIQIWNYFHPITFGYVPSSAYLQPSNNLSDVLSSSTALANLGAGSGTSNVSTSSANTWSALQTFLVGGTAIDVQGNATFESAGTETVSLNRGTTSSLDSITPPCALRIPFAISLTSLSRVVRTVRRNLLRAMLSI